MREYFEGMTDPRQEAKVKHSFIETIMIVICAVIIVVLPTLFAVTTPFDTLATLFFDDLQ